MKKIILLFCCLILAGCINTSDSTVIDDDTITQYTVLEQALNDEISELRILLDEKVDRIGSYKFKIDMLNDKSEFHEEKIKNLESDINELNQVLKTYESYFPKLSSEESQAVIETVDSEIIILLNQRNYTQLANYIHPEKGVRFTPYSESKATDQLLTKEEFLDNIKTDPTLNWGYYANPDNPEGFPIELTLNEYLETFVYQGDYINSDVIGYNERVNHHFFFLPEFEHIEYKDSIVVEHFIDDDSYDFLSIKIVYQKYEESWYIVAFINNEWTIGYF